MGLEFALFVKVLLFPFPVLATEDVLDILYYSTRPFFDGKTTVGVRGYTLNDDVTENITLDILNYDRGLWNVTWADRGTCLCKTVFSGSKCTNGTTYRPATFASKFLGVEISTEQNYPTVFSLEAKKNGTTTRTAIVMVSSTAKITFEQRTLAVGLGENVEIRMNTNQPLTDIRWTHNYGDVISKWNGSSTIKIEDVREQDGGVYECYQDKYGKDGNHGIMRLIVRACPSPKWNPPSCELDCPVCYNGGVCNDRTGLCICPAGFKGINCETGCGSQYFGRYCNVPCKKSDEESCKNKLFCPPDPVGCSCTDGYGGLDCSRKCDAGWYGASCQQMCHCNVTYCDRKYGCINDSCWDGYTGPQCQVLPSDKSCPSGFFGELCNYPCHCLAGGDCNRNDGSCTNGCNESWAGSNCSIALPYLSAPPFATAYTSTISVDVTWTQGRDYGSGTITSWTLWYKKQGNSDFTSINSSTPDVINITGLKLYENVTYYSILSRSVEGVITSGPASPQGIIQTTCLEPLSPSPPTIKSVSRNHLEIQWELVPNDPSVIQCDGVLRYQVGYRNTTNSIRAISNTSSNTVKMMRISDLLECTEYILNLRVVNNGEIASPWSKTIRIKTSPPETSDALFSQITTIALAIISVISTSVMSASLCLLRKAKRQIKNLSMNQKQVEDMYVNQSSIINPTDLKGVSEDVYLGSMPAEEHIYTDLKSA